MAAVVLSVEYSTTGGKDFDLEGPRQFMLAIKTTIYLENVISE